MEKVKLFTHTDLDGIGCAIFAMREWKDVDVEYCDYNNINEKVSKFYSGEVKLEYSKVYITDISVNEEVAELINTFNSQISTTLLDHHKTALWLNKYDWAKVEEIDKKLNEKTSGTFMMYRHFIDGYENSKLYDLCNMVRQYDTWIWKDKNLSSPKMLNDLFHIYGRDSFIDKISKYLDYASEHLFNETDSFLLSLKQKEINNYINKKNEGMMKIEYTNYKVGVIYAERFVSEMGNRLCELNSDIDFIVIINMDHSVSYRTIKDIDLSEIAKVFGGGGHPKASGSPIEKDLKIKFIENYLKIIK